MKRIAVIADSHYDETKRFDECIRIHNWIADDMAQRGVDLAIHTGDVYERKSTPRERTAATAWAQRIADLCPFLIVRGNHDYEGDLEIFGRLERKFPIVVEERAGVHVLGRVAVAAVAWPRKAHLLALLGDASQQEADQAARDALRNVFLGLRQQLEDYTGPKVLAMHAMVRGSMTSVGQPLVGCDMEIGLEDLALVGADFYALGHIHKGQDWLIENTPVVFPGSPRRTAFGEIEAKGYVLVTIDDERGLVDWEFIETPCTPMVQLTATWDGVAFTGSDELIARAEAGAEVRFRYTVDPDQREPAKRAAEAFRDDLIAMGSLSVKLEEEVTGTTRARMPELAAATTLAEKLSAFWTSRGDDLSEERRARLLGKLARVEEEHRACA